MPKGDGGTRNLTIPGRLKPAQRIIHALADEATELARQVEREPWRRLAMRSAVAVSQSKREKEARRHLENVYGYIEKERRFGKPVK